MKECQLAHNKKNSPFCIKLATLHSKIVLMSVININVQLTDLFNLTAKIVLL